jgi:hypothetical protein
VGEPFLGDRTKLRADVLTKMIGVKVEVLDTTPGGLVVRTAWSEPEMSEHVRHRPGVRDGIRR